MCLLGIGAELYLEVSSVSGGGVGDCRDGCSIVIVAIFAKSSGWKSPRSGASLQVPSYYANGYDNLGVRRLLTRIASDL